MCIYIKDLSYRESPILKRCSAQPPTTTVPPCSAPRRFGGVEAVVVTGLNVFIPVLCWSVGSVLSSWRLVKR